MFVQSRSYPEIYQSVHPDGPSMWLPKNETCVAGKKEGQGVRRTGS
jgi:hypothetical protein